MSAGEGEGPFASRIADGISGLGKACRTPGALRHVLFGCYVLLAGWERLCVNREGGGCGWLAWRGGAGELIGPGRQARIFFGGWDCVIRNTSCIDRSQQA